MKRFFLAIAITALAVTSQAQTYWDLQLNKPNYADSPRLGTLNDVPLELYTNNQKRMSIDIDGGIAMPSLSIGKGQHLLTIDESGNLRPIGGGGHIYYCNSTIPWYLGGNQWSTINDIGTCDDQDFVLKAHDRKMVFIKSADPFIGIGPGNSSPAATLDISDGNTGALGSLNHTRILGDDQGTIESTGSLNFVSPSGFTYSSGSIANGYNTRFLINSGNGFVGINTTSPDALLDARAATNAELRVFSTSTTTSPSKIWVLNHAYSYNLGIDAAGIGHIGDNINSSTPHYLLNFKQGAGGIPQVWIGDKLVTTGAHADAKFAVYGKMVAQELIVTLQNWNLPDYVFADGYKLRSLAEVEAYYKSNHHLPEVPSAAEVEYAGINVAEMNTILLKKIEELTLYTVEQQKQLEVLKKEVSALRAKSGN